MNQYGVSTQDSSNETRKRAFSIRAAVEHQTAKEEKRLKEIHPDDPHCRICGARRPDVQRIGVCRFCGSRMEE